MKFKTTKKAIIDQVPYIYSIGYCALQNLLYYESPIAYTGGTYGWNADIYIFGDHAIVTGYRSFGRNVDYTVIKKYEEQAWNLRQLGGTREDLRTLLDELSKELNEG